MIVRRPVLTLTACAALLCPLATTAAAKKPVVKKPAARIVSLHGHALYAKHGTKLVALHQGASLPRGSWLVIGPRTSVTIRVTIGKKSKLANSTKLLFITRYKKTRPKAKAVAKDLAVLAGGAKYRPVVRLTNSSISAAAK